MSGLSWRERLRRMNQRSLFSRDGRSGGGAAAQVAGSPEDLSSAGQVRAEAVQRLQVGLFGIGAMVLLVGLASIIGGQAERNDELAVPEAAPTTEPSAAPPQANPLADAGVVPDIDAEPEDEAGSAPDAGAAPASPAPGNAAPSQ